FCSAGRASPWCLRRRGSAVCSNTGPSTAAASIPWLSPWLFLLRFLSGHGHKLPSVFELLQKFLFRNLLHLQPQQIPAMLRDVRLSFAFLNSASQQFF